MLLTKKLFLWLCRFRKYEVTLHKTLMHKTVKWCYTLKYKSYRYTINIARCESPRAPLTLNAC